MHRFFAHCGSAYSGPKYKHLLRVAGRNRQNGYIMHCPRCFTTFTFPPNN